MMLKLNKLWLIVLLVPFILYSQDDFGRSVFYRMNCDACHSIRCDSLWGDRTHPIDISNVVFKDSIEMKFYLRGEIRKNGKYHLMKYADKDEDLSKISKWFCELTNKK